MRANLLAPPAMVPCVALLSLLGIAALAGKSGQRSRISTLDSDYGFEERGGIVERGKSTVGIA